MKDVYVIDGARTPFGSFGGSLKDISMTELGKIATEETVKKSGISKDDIDQVVFGNVIHTSSNASFLARHIALHAGIPERTPALTVNRLCGSGLQAVVNATQSLKLGEGETAIAGGAENMSMSPHVVRGIRFNGVKMGVPHMEDMLNSTLTDAYCGIGMGITAENLAEKYNISRDEQEQFSLHSQEKAIKAMDKDRFVDEIVPVLDENDEVLLQVDEHPKRHVTLDKLKKLTPAFKKSGSVTAATSSGINDGAAAVLLATEDAVKEKALNPLARIVSWGIAGVDPTIMGIGPVPATRMALERANLQMEDIDLIEINEAFAVQVLSCQKELGFDMEKLNVNGGAIALGHPVGASGARLLLTLSYELKKRQLRYGLASLCIGGGQGISVIIENMHM